MQLANANTPPTGDDLGIAADALAARLGHGADPAPLGSDALLRRALLYAAQVQRRLARSESDLARLRSLSVTDELTGLLNRRGLIAEGSRLCAAARRYRWDGAVIYVDLDGFKAVNDRFGHAAGDALLVSVARALTDSVRQSDVVGRLGGDEFAVVLARTSEAGMRDRVWTLQQKIEAARVAWAGHELAPRASLGAAPFHPGATIEEALGQADAAMYAEKHDRCRRAAAEMAA
jgi:diguanylate cyclase (GGDEF)-like protein